jgi:hypothetical protein
MKNSTVERNDGHTLPAIHWPEGKQFAFTVFDDTDLSTVKNVPPVYDHLERNGFRTTKSVWPSEGTHESKFGGSTCDVHEYLEWVLDLKKRGFEIGMHNVTHHSSTREECLAGIQKFTHYFGHPPFIHANHVDCADGLYWGPHRFTGINRLAYTVMTRGKRNDRYEGHIESSRYFWGDICRQHVQYVRDFVFPDINTLKACPYMPYHDARRPYVNQWFASSEGANVDLFAAMLSEKNQDTLEREGGACIMYTHFASGFYRDGALDRRFKFLIERLGKKNGWFVPVRVLLDHIAVERGVYNITPQQRKRLERKFLMDRALLRLAKFRP